MPFRTLVSPETLLGRLDDPTWRVVDCRFKLADAESGRRDYAQAHIIGALYAHLNEDLSGPVVPGLTGRHPLPSIEKIAHFFSRLGIDDGIQVVAYDDAGGALAAGRLWWLLRWLGHADAAVLDGGWQAWLEIGGPLGQAVRQVAEARFIPRPEDRFSVTTQEVEALRLDPVTRILASPIFSSLIPM